MAATLTKKVKPAFAKKPNAKPELQQMVLEEFLGQLDEKSLLRVSRFRSGAAINSRLEQLSETSEIRKLTASEAEEYEDALQAGNFLARLKILARRRLARQPQ